MTHLRIEQNNGVIEEVSSSVITKLYEIAHAGLDVSSNLLGRLHSPVGIRSLVQWLTTTYPDLYINVDDYTIEFEDPKVVTYLNSIGVGSNGIVTEAQAAAATAVATSANTEVTKFNELRYFTNITESRGGFNGSTSGWVRFSGWTGLEEVDISNFTSLGHTSGNAPEDTFYGCTSLKTVTASNKLTKIGYRAFRGCSNLESITGLEGTISFANEAFKDCSKLTNESIENALFKPAIDNTLRGGGAFENTTFTEITMSPEMTEVPGTLFMGNTKLEKVNGLENVTVYNALCFLSCTKFTGPIDFTNVTYIGGSAFLSSGLTGNVDLKHIQTFAQGNNFGNTKITSVNYNGNSITGYASAFSGCTNLVTASGMQNVTNPTGSMFLGCTALTSVDFNWSNVTNHTVPSHMFRDCRALSSIDLTGAIAVNERAFENCTSLTTVTSPDLTYLGIKAFYNCSHLTTLGLSNVTTISSRALNGCSSLRGDLFLKNLHGGYSNGTWLDDGALSGSGFDSITITSSVLQRISEGPGNGKIGVMDGCPNLLKINVLGCSALTMFGGAANCPNLKTVILPSLCNTFNYNAFYNSNQLESLVLQYDGVATLPTGNGQLYFITSPLGKIYVPATYVNDYKTTYPYFESRIDSFIHYPGEWEFVDKTFSTSEFEGASFSGVIIKGNTTVIPYLCFKNAASLEHVQINAPVTQIDSSVFLGCSSLLNVDLSNTSITYIPTNFMNGGATNITIKFPTTVTSTASASFDRCLFTTLTLILPGNTVVDDGNGWANNFFNSNLTGLKIYVPDNLVSQYESTLASKYAGKVYALSTYTES